MDFWEWKKYIQGDSKVLIQTVKLFMSKDRINNPSAPSYEIKCIFLGTITTLSIVPKLDF